MIDICIHGEINIVRVEEQKNILIIYLKDILSTDKYLYNVIITLLLIKKWRKINPYNVLPDAKLDSELMFMNAAVTRKGDFQIMEFQIEYKNDLNLAIMAFNSMLKNFQSEITEKDLQSEIKKLLYFVDSKKDVFSNWVLSEFYSLMFEKEPFSIGEYNDVSSLDNMNVHNIIEYFNAEYCYLSAIIMVPGYLKKEMPIAASVHLNEHLKSETSLFHLKAELDVGEQCVVIIGYRTTCFMQSHEYWAMLVLNTLLAGEKDSILARRLKYTLKMSYETFSLYDEIKGFIVIRVITERKFSEKVLEEVNRTLKFIRNAEYDASCLINAKKMLKEYFETGTSLQIMDFYLKQQLSGVYINVESAVSRINEVTIQDITKVAALLYKDTIVIAENNGLNR
jgi:hypothetical protein